MAAGRHSVPRYSIPQPRRSARRWLIVTFIGVLLAAAGAFVITHALIGSGGSLPAGALVIPSNVGTAVPTPSVVPTAVPLAASDPVRIEIPALNVSAPVTQLGLNRDGSVQVPPLSNHNLAGWYSSSVTPGERGSASRPGCGARRHTGRSPGLKAGVAGPVGDSVRRRPSPRPRPFGIIDLCRVVPTRR